MYGCCYDEVNKYTHRHTHLPLPSLDGYISTTSQLLVKVVPYNTVTDC